MKTTTIIQSLFATAAASVLLAGCSTEELLPHDGTRTPVSFTAAVQTAQPAAPPQTRTAIDPGGNTVWTEGDRVGIFMLPAGGSVSDAISGAKNIAYSVDPVTGALSLVSGTPIYYPMDQAVDFAAYYPFRTEPYVTNPPIADQTTVEKQAAIDFLYSDNAKNIRSGRDPVALEFRHLMSKVKLDITLGEGLADGKITKVELQSKFMLIAIDLWLGSGRQSGVASEEPISMLKSAVPTAGVDATFTALVHPLSITEESVSLVVTVNDEEYTGPISLTGFESNTTYVYPVTVQKRKVTVGDPVIKDWTTNDNGTGEASLVVNIEKVRIPAGTFQMGSSDTDLYAEFHEKPRHWVRLTRDFYMGKYEVTRVQYAAFLNAMGVQPPTTNNNVMGNVEGYGVQRLFRLNKFGWTPLWNEETSKWETTGDYPMTNVTWYGAKAFADWVGGRLPTEAEWEYACRAGTETNFFFGNDYTLLGDYDVYKDNQENNGPSRVGSKKPNPWGLYDMHGNLDEWCQDGFDGSNYPEAATEAKAVVDPLVPTGDKAVARGGCFIASWHNCRSACRFNYQLNDNFAATGFRVVFD